MSRHANLLFINFRPEGEKTEASYFSKSPEKPDRPDFSGEQAKEFYESITSSTVPSSETSVRDECCEAAFGRATRAEKESRRVKGQWKRNVEKPAGKDAASASAGDLFNGCQNGDSQLVRRALKSLRHDGDEAVSRSLHSRDAFGWTPLMCAAFAGHLEIVRLILDFCDRRCTDASCTTRSWWNVTDKKNRNASDLAILGGHEDVEQELLSYKQDLRQNTYATDNSLGQDESQKLCRQVHEGAMSGDMISNSQTVLRCDLCHTDFPASKQNEHLASTVHRLNVHEHTGDSPPVLYALPSHNPGYQLMVRDGWKPEKGLGTREDGRKLPIKTHLKRSRAGLGCRESSDPKGKRITHFAAHDSSSVTRSRGHPKPVQLLETKKEMTKRKEQERRKEIAWRRELRQDLH